MPDEDALQLSRLIDQSSLALAKWTLADHLEQDPTLSERYEGNWRAQWEAAIVTRIRYLAQAIAVDEPAVFTESVNWLRSAFRSREARHDDLRVSLLCLRGVLAEHLPAPVSERTLQFCDIATEALAQSDAIDDGLADEPLDATVLGYLEALFTGNRAAARDVCLQALEDGRTLEDVMLRIIQPAQAALGRMWHANEISIADEHAATAITESILAVLAERQSPASPVGRKVVATTVGGEQHSIGLRIVALAFELAGWDCLYVGADVPHPDVQAAVLQHRADVLAISCTSRLHLRSVAELIDLVRRADEDPPGILVGGRAFIAFPDLWRQVGADRVALDAFEGVRIANELTSASSA